MANKGDPEEIKWSMFKKKKHIRHSMEGSITTGWPKKRRISEGSSEPITANLIWILECSFLIP